MNSKQFKINLLFQADTSLAVQNIQQLGSMLNTLKTNTTIGFNSGSIQKAITDVKQLQLALQSAVNVNTGKLDLSKFNTSLKMSKTSLDQYSSSLLALGPQGQQAFARLATAISQAEAPMYRLNARTREMLSTLGNTAKWQIASSAIHGVVGAFSEGIRYIEDFDKALADIRIVSDINNEELLSFAKNTHKIAKEVNSTSLEVAKGATIYYQQGLDTKDVEERVRITTKMANVTRESAETVSSQLTAIWNNFSDGTDSLESYADVLTYLGATTAADTNQIATAMQKFAASAKTVGLSYDYASAAVARVISRTQMAPEEVGTAFKTILSRMQGLELGKTLEDGVGLNKYAEALDVVGVKVLDANGGLRDADLILDDLGAKWDNLDSAQKKALATTVAGVRQQTQFMALMEEWDSIETTVNELGESTGFLTEKNEEYANSIEGVKDRWTQTKQEFMKNIFGDSDAIMKGFYETLIDLTKGAETFIQSFGGLKPMLLTFAGLFSKSLMPMLLNGTRNLLANIATLFGFTEANAKRLQQEFFNLTQTKLNSGLIDPAMEKQLTIAHQLTLTKQRLQEAVKNQGQYEKDIANMQIQQLEYATSEVQKELEKQHSLEKQVEMQRELLVNQNRGALGTAAGIHRYQEGHPETEGMSKEEMDEITKIATTTRTKDIDAQIAYQEQIKSGTIKTQGYKDLNNQKTDIQQQIAEQNKIVETKGSNDSLSKGTEEARIANAKAVEEANKRINELKKQEKDIEEQIAQTNKEDVKNAEEEIKKLEMAKELREEINNSRRKFNADTVISKDVDSVSAVVDEGPSKDKGAHLAGNAIVNDLDAGVEAKFNEATQQTTITTETSIANTEKLIKKRGELTATTQKAAAMEKDIGNLSKKTQNALKGANSSSKNYQKTLQQSKKEAKNFGKEMKEMLQSTLGLKKGNPIIKDLNNALKSIDSAQTSEQFDKGCQKMINALQKLQNGGKEAGLTMDDAIDRMLNSLKESGAGVAGLEQLEKSLRELGLITPEIEAKIKALKNEMTNTGPVTTFGSLITSGIGKLGQLAGSLQMAASGINMIKNAFNEAASPGEALMNYLSGLSMLLPVVGTAFSGVSKAVKFLIGDKIKLNAVSLATIATTYKSAAAQAKDAGMTGFAAAAYAMKACIEELGWPGIIVGGIAAAAIAAMFGFALKGALGAMGAGKEKQTEEQEKEAAAKTTQALNESLEQTKQRAEDIKTGFSEYNEIANKLAKCKKGTDEWNEALLENNNKVNELLDKYPELAKIQGAISIGENGELVISAEAQQEAINMATRKIAEDQLAKFNNDQANFQKTYYKDSDGNKRSQKAKEITEDIVSDKGISSVTLDGFVNKFFDQYGKSNSVNAQDVIAMASEYFDGITSLDEDTKQKLVELVTTEQEFTTELKNNTAAIRANSLAIGAQAMAGNEEYEKSKFKENAGAIAGNVIMDVGDNPEEYEDYEEIRSALKEHTGSGDSYKWTGSDKQSQYYDEFLQAMNIDRDSFMTEYDGDFQDTGVSMKVTGEDGKPEELFFTYEQMARKIAATRQLEAAEGDSEALIKEMNKFGADENKADIFTALSTGDNSWLSEDLLEKPLEDLEAIVDELDISDEALKAMGEEAKKFGKTTDEQKKNYKEYTKELLASAKGFKEFEKNGKAALAAINAEGKTVFDKNGKKIGQWSEQAKKEAANISKSLSDALGSESDLGLDPDFIYENMAIINDFLNDVDGAGEKLQAKLQEDALIDIQANVPEEAHSKIASLHNELLNMAKEDWTVGVAIDDTNFIAKCNEIIANANMTAKQAKAYFGKMGFDVEFHKEPQKVTETVWDYTYRYDEETLDDGTTRPVARITDAKARTVEGTVDVPAIKTITPNASYGGNIKKISNGASAAKPAPTKTDTGGGGGGGSKGDSKGNSKKSKPKKAETKDPYQEVTRYRNTDNLLEKQERVLNKLSRKKDGAYGKKYLEAIEAENKAIAEENALLEWQATEALTYRDQDIEALKSFGIEVVLDENGNISNLESIEKQIAERENNIEIEYAAKYNAAGENEEAQEAADEWKKQQEKDLESIKFYFNGATDASKKYYDVTEQMEENLIQIKENNFEKIQKKLEDQIELIDRENEMIELQNKLLEDNYKKSPELYQNIFKINKNDLKSLNEYIASYNKAMDPNEQLTDAHRAELIQKAYDGITDKIGAFIDRFNDMKQAFSDTMDSWNDDMQLIYDQFDHFIGITESYEEIMGLLGRSTDYTALGNLYSAREAHSREKYLASVGEYDAKLKLIQEERAKLEDPGMTETARAIVEENIKKLTEEVHEAQDTMLQNAVAWGEALKTILHNTLQAAAAELEETLTGSTFDEINQQMEFTQAKQEDYLTSTNQQYETQKMIRTAQLAIEKTENEVARRKLELFKKETQELQNQEKLSKYQLDYQQASYEVLLAEIALQEAQNTKSQVRLQRDSEGNFNYVYTADENKIAEAQQQYEDAVNNRYNVSLEAANEFAEKYKSTMEEYLNAVQEVIDDETLSTEQKNEKIEALTQEYYAQLLNYQELYGDASGDLGDRLNEAWTTDMMNNIASAEEFKTNTNTYVGEVQSAFKTFQVKIDELSGYVSGDFVDITEKAGKLAEQMQTTQTDGSSALQKLSQDTAAWANSSEGDLLTILNYWLSIADVMGMVLDGMSGYANEVDYMAGFEKATTQREARAFLEGRQQKYTADPWYAEEYGENRVALMEETRDQSNQLIAANTVAEALGAAARRQVKLEFLSPEDAARIIAESGTTWDMLVTKITTGLGISMEEFLKTYDLTGWFEDIYQTATDSQFGGGKYMNDQILALLNEIKNTPNYFQHGSKKRMSSATFDTGGYTGDFGPEGRYAVLHEKELVLNADDTANLLDTIDIVRGLVDNIEYRALMQSFGRMSAPIVNLTNETLEQDVTIHAEFPNVQDKNEIEEAFNNLINTASQYANRKNR